MEKGTQRRHIVQGENFSTDETLSRIFGFRKRFLYGLKSETIIKLYVVSRHEKNVHIRFTRILLIFAIFPIILVAYTSDTIFAFPPRLAEIKTYVLQVTINTDNAAVASSCLHARFVFDSAVFAHLAIRYTLHVSRVGNDLFRSGENEFIFFSF